MNQCTVGDHCAAGACVADTSLACSDGNACTVDSCLPASGCAFAPGNDGAWCNDGNACTLGDQCAAGDCKGTKPVTCTDNDVCTKDTCNPATGCVFPPDADGIPCNDGNACTVTDACAAGKCAGSGTPNCDDGKACTTDACNPASGCTHALIAPCCGNGLVEAGEQCDDGNNAGGDGCSASCTNESPCPADVAYVQSLCWVKANAWQESHSAACARIGKTATAKEVSIPWDNSVLLQVASKWGYTSIGDFENSAHAMWCNNAAKHCGTHNWGTPFDNYGPYGDSNYWPVYTCKP